MYSVQDLLISHGYQLPQNAPSSCERRYADCRREIAGNRSSHGTVNGYKTDTGAYVYSRQSPARGYSTNNECRERNQRRKAVSGNQGDTQLSGDFSITDSGFYEGTRGMYSQPRDERDVSFWRRRGQNFNTLLDYSEQSGNQTEQRGSGVANADKMQRAQNLSSMESRPERQRCGNSLGPTDMEQWMMADDRKCQSLGTDEWRPAMGLSQQISDGEGERWTYEEQIIAATVGCIQSTGTGKSQSLPRVLSPENIQYADASEGSQEAYSNQRFNGSLSQGPHNKSQKEATTRDGHTTLLPKPRFSRPLKPPSYEAHQQIRGSMEMLAGDLVALPKDKTQHLPRSVDCSRQDHSAQDSSGSGVEPPGYIPPPSYNRPLLQKDNYKSCSEPKELLLSNYNLKGEPLQQMAKGKEVGKWFYTHSGSSFLDMEKDVSAPCRKLIHPEYKEEHLGCVQYISFDDPRVRHISGGACGNSLTNSDIVNKEFSSAKVSEQSSQACAFLPPQGSLITIDTTKIYHNENDNGNRWCNRLHKDSENSAAFDQSCKKHPADQPCTSFQTRSSLRNANLEHKLFETVTHVKKIEPSADTDKRNSKRKLNETIFCLVSVPVHMLSNGELPDQNNNNEKVQCSGGTIDSNSTFVENQSLLSTSSSDFDKHTLSGSVRNRFGRKKSNHRKVPMDKLPILLNKHRERQYSGSWPGDQYRDQETQTSSPEGSKGLHQSPGKQKAQDQAPSTTDNTTTTTDSNIGTDCSNKYGYLMKGQKSLNPSSNSAFSKTANFSTQLSKSNAQLSQSSGNQEDASCSVQKNDTKTSVGNVQEVFGQFLLKPVSRRPWDAIEELESFNKELQEQFSKQPNVDQCIEDLDEAYKDILELGNTSSNVGNVRLSDMDDNNSGSVLKESFCASQNIGSTLESLSTTVEPHYREVKSAFSRPYGKTSFNKLNEERLTRSETALRDQSLIAQISKKTFSFGNHKDRKSDITVPRECLFKGVSLTVYTEAQLKQDSLALASLPNYEDGPHSLPLSLERPASTEYTFGNQSIGPPKPFQKPAHRPSSKTDSQKKAKKDNIVPKFSGEKTINVFMIKRPKNRYLGRGSAHCILSDEPAAEEIDDVAASCDDISNRFNWRKQLSYAGKHLEALLIPEKTHSLPAEDLSNLFEVKCADGIPENESIEERAARILGIDVPAESLGVMDHKKSKPPVLQKKTSKQECVSAATPECINEEISEVKRKSEEVKVKPVLPNGQVKGTEKKPENGKESTVIGENDNSLDSSSDVSDFREDSTNDRPLLGLSERKGRSTSRMIEALQDKLAAATCWSAVERIARMKEVDSVSRMRLLSIKSSDSGEDAEGEAEFECDTRPVHQTKSENILLRKATVAKREISLPLSFSIFSKGTELKDEESMSLSDSYDPSRVEKV